MKPSEQMRDLGVVQCGAPILNEPARAFELPAEHEAAEDVVDRLFAAMEQISQIHLFAKGMGVAAPQSASAAPLPSSSHPPRTPRPSCC